MADVSAYQRPGYLMTVAPTGRTDRAGGTRHILAAAWRTDDESGEVRWEASRGPHAGDVAFRLGQKMAHVPAARLAQFVRIEYDDRGVSDIQASHPAKGVAHAAGGDWWLLAVRLLVLVLTELEPLLRDLLDSRPLPDTLSA